MATIEKRKRGYLIRVSCGYSADGKRHLSQSMTWRPPREGMTDKQIERALNKAAADFETQCKGGRVVNVAKLQNFIEQWFTVHQKSLKASTIKKYRDCCPRIYAQLGHIRLDKIKTRDIDNFLTWLGNERHDIPLAKFKTEIKPILLEHGYKSIKSFARETGIDEHSLRAFKYDNAIRWETAVKISEALDIPPASIFKKQLSNEKLSPKTIRGYHGFLSSVFNYAVKVGEIAVNPCRNCTLPKMNLPEHKILSIEQTQEFLSLLDEYAPLKYRCFFNIAVYSGFRRGEILGLQWKDIDFDNNLISINRAQHWDKKNGYYYTDPKTVKSKRTIRVSDRVMFLLKQMHNEQISAAFNYGDRWDNKDNLVFTRENGSNMSMNTAGSFLRKFCKEHDLPAVNVHSMRHLNATLLINSGANPKTVQSLLGHSMASTTMNIYAHEIQSAEAAASSALAAMLENRLTKKKEQA